MKSTVTAVSMTLKEKHMQTRRNFLKYISIVGMTSFSGITLYAKSPENVMQVEAIGSTYMDAFFDPDDWL
jgi:hypothetical protein